MPTRSATPSLEKRVRGLRVYLSPARTSDTPAFLAAVAASRRLHFGWVEPPSTRARFAHYVNRFANGQSENPAKSTHYGLLVRRVDDNALVGVFNFSEIVRGSFDSGYLGYYAFAPYHGEGYMGEAIGLVLDTAFRTLKLHRVEANIQPTNVASIELVRRAGFTREGYSRRYVKVGGRWRDHERWAMLAEDWRARRRQRR